MIYNKEPVRLYKKEGRYMLQLNGSKSDVAVKVIRARPLQGDGRDIAFVDEKRRLVAMIESLDVLDNDSRTVAEEALEIRYFLAKVLRVIKTTTHFGTRFWDVETDKGRRKFALRDPNRNVLYSDDDRILVRDTLGNYYEIESLSKLDRRSVTEIEKVI
jgi:hypothetical protein